METQQKCLFCQKTSDEVPLVNITFKQKLLWICSQHLPLLIHEPAKLSEQLSAAVKE